MKKIIFTILLFAAVLLFGQSDAQAYYIIDTGPGNPTAPGWGADAEYWYAAEIQTATTNLTFYR